MEIKQEKLLPICWELIFRALNEGVNVSFFIGKIKALVQDSV
jgi:hypothetical protein